MEESYIIRIYRRDHNVPYRITGLVEDVGRQATKAFQNIEELAALLGLPYSGPLPVRPRLPPACPAPNLAPSGAGRSRQGRVGQGQADPKGMEGKEEKDGKRNKNRMKHQKRRGKKAKADGTGPHP